MILKSHSPITLEDFDQQCDQWPAFVLFAPHLVAMVGLCTYPTHGALAYFRVFKTADALGPVNPWNWLELQYQELLLPQGVLKKVAMRTCTLEVFNKTITQLRKRCFSKSIVHHTLSRYGIKDRRNHQTGLLVDV